MPQECGGAVLRLFLETPEHSPMCFLGPQEYRKSQRAEEADIGVVILADDRFRAPSQRKGSMNARLRDHLRGR
jgi:hypothetical protein